MDYNEELLTHLLQCPAGSVVGRRNVEVKREKSSNERVGWTLGVKTSRPKISIKLSSCVCNDNEPCMAHHRYSDDEHEGDSDNNCGRDTVYTKVEASQKDIQHRKDKAQTQMPSTKPKARTLVASRQLIDGNEVASLRDQSQPHSTPSRDDVEHRLWARPYQETRPPLTLRGTASLAASDPRRTSSVHTSVTGQASESAVLQDAASTEPGWSNSSREEIKKQYYKDLCRQIEERNQQRERERRRNNTDEQKHNETMQHSIWGMPGSGAPNYHLGTAKRTKSLCTAGILPQEQIRDKGFSGIPFSSL